MTTKTAQFTPGPWYAANMGNDFQGLVVEEQTGKNIAVAYDKRDVHILAAAPAMYAALREAEKHLTDLANYGAEGIPEPLLVSVRSAIAQAEGRHPRKEETCK